jgi:hypothetical protein
MSVGIAAIVERAATIIASLTPDTEPSVPFARISPEMKIESEPPTQARLFQVEVSSQTPTLTAVSAGRDIGMFTGRFYVTVIYDAGTDQVSGQARDAEDTERIIFALETDTGMPAGTRSMRCTGGAVLPNPFAGDQFWHRTMEFEVTYERTF